MMQYLSEIPEPLVKGLWQAGIMQLIMPVSDLRSMNMFDTPIVEENGSEDYH